MELEKLLGRTVMQVLANPERDEFRFVTDGGDLDYHCFGDCCSESWVNHITDIDTLIGQLGVEPESTRQEEDEVLFHRIQTPKGVCVIEFRNSSNGYYGGSFEEGLCKPNDLQPVTEDF